MATLRSFLLSKTKLLDEDATLAVQARSDTEAFAVLYRRYVDRVFRYALSRVGSTDEAEDITAQTFLEVVEGLDRYRPDGAFAAWLFTIVRRRCADYYRHRRPSAPLEEADALPFPAPDLLSRVIQEEETQALARRVGELDDEERELIFLRFAGELRIAEIAQLLGKKESAVKMRLYRLLEQLGQRWEREDYG